ncbi:MAG TPA: hypothetical protein VI248_01805 [Kineosporiaceae bacterium]
MRASENEQTLEEYLRDQLVAAYRTAFHAEFERLYGFNCPLCGSHGPHDQAACDVKMAAWAPTGLLGHTGAEPAS